MKNYIAKLHAKNVGLFEDLNIEFNEKFNFIAGPNGCGKTSILKILALAFSNAGHNVFRYGDNPSLWADVIYGKKAYRVGFGEGSIRPGEKYRNASCYTYKVPPAEGDIVPLQSILIGKSDFDASPLFLGTYRKIPYKEIIGMTKEDNVKKQRSTYRSIGLKNIEGVALPSVKQWIINRYFIIDKEWAKIYKQNWEWIINKLGILAPSNFSLVFKEIEKDFEPQFILNGLDCYLEEVSAGFQSILSIVFAIVEWIEGVNEDDDSYIPNATGTVIIDELDAHLHPEWQLTIRDALSEIFPKLQFIITTHSPHLIATAKQKELIILPQLARSLKVKPTAKTYSGWSTDEILKDVMQVRSLENKEYSKLIKEALDYVENSNTPELEKIIKKIKKVVHPSNALVQVLNIKLETLKLRSIDDKNQ